MPFLYELVDTLYNGVMEFMPGFFQERPMFSAPALGASGAFGLARALQEISWRWMDKAIPKFDMEWLPVLEKACLAGIPAVALSYALADPGGAMEVVQSHPVYAAGMSAAYAGGAAAAVHDLHERALESAMHPEARLLNRTRIHLDEVVETTSLKKNIKIKISKE